MNIKNFIPQPAKDAIKMIDGYVLSKINAYTNNDFMCDVNTKRCFNNIKSPNYKYEYFGKNTPICCVTNLYTILRDVTKVLEEKNLEYFISFGTLLGAVRHGGLIPWDTDMDIIVAEKDIDNITDTLQKAFDGKKTYVVREDTYSGNVGSIVRVDLSKINTLHIDLFTYLDKDDYIVFERDLLFSKDEIYPLIKIPFYDLQLYAPKNYLSHLEKQYGADYMEYAYKQWALNKKKFKLTDNSPAIIDVK